MPTLHVEYKTEEERRLLEQAIAFIGEMRDLAKKAPAGRVIDVCEGYALDEGRKLLRNTLQSAVQARVDEVEEKGARPASARAPSATASKGGMAGS